MRVPDNIHTVQDEITAREQRKSQAVQFQQVDPSEQEEFEPAPGPSGMQAQRPAPDTSDEEVEPEQE